MSGFFFVIVLRDEVVYKLNADEEYCQEDEFFEFFLRYLGHDFFTDERS